MRILTPISLYLFFLGLFSSIAHGQQPTPSPSSKEGNWTRIGSAVSSLRDELTQAEVEPRSKQFRMNIGFLRAKYSRPSFGGILGQQYKWDYFPEATVIVKFYEIPAGSYPSDSAEERKQKVSRETEMTFAGNNFKIIAAKDVVIGSELAKDYEISLGDEKLRQRVFVNNGVWYSLLAEVKTSDAGPLIDKLFDSFEFVKGGPAASVQPQPKDSLRPTNASVENGVFESMDGGFSIAIPQMPSQTLDKGTQKAKAKGVDTGKQFVWRFEKTLYTAFYKPAVDTDGNPLPQVWDDMETGTRKGILRSNAKLISEKPIKLGENRGTEFRYVSAEGVRYIGRLYLIGDVGYQIVGGYAEQKDEKTVLEVLESFKLVKR